jgi:signal transduction histidine kinase
VYTIVIWQNIVSVWRHVSLSAFWGSDFLAELTMKDFEIMQDRASPDTILVISAQPSHFAQLPDILGAEYVVVFSPPNADAEQHLHARPAAVVADQRLLAGSEIELLKKSAAAAPETKWILLAADAIIQTPDALPDSATIYAILPNSWNAHTLAGLIKRAVEYARLEVAQQRLYADFQALQAQQPLLQEQTSAHNTHTHKMALLGQLLAGIAHEINTPAGALNAAIGNLSHHLKALVKSLRELEQQQFTVNDFEQFIWIIAGMVLGLDEHHRRSSGEIRAEETRLATLFAQQNIPGSRNLAKHIARLELGEYLTELLLLIKKYDREQIIAFLTHWSRVVNSVKDIQVSTEMLMHIVRALRSYSYPRQPKPASANIHETIETAVTILTNKLKHGIRVQRQYADLPLLNCYASELNHVWLNLLLNAIQAMQGKGEIQIETFAAATELGVRITDNGPGIPPEIQHRIFERHFTTKPQGEGTGLGLTLVQEIIARHGGAIQVTSQPGQTTFEVRLPFRLPPEN